MKKRLLILGAGVMQGPAIRLAEKLGLKTIAVDGNPDAACAGLASEFYNIDLKDKESILKLARRLKDEAPPLAGIMTAGTDFSTSVAFVAQVLGLPGISYETALKASDKEKMRACFRGKPVPSPDYISPDAALCMRLCREDGLTSAGELLPFDLPVVVKPVDNMGARGCRLARSPEELALAVREALPCSRSSRIIIEEYIEGEEYSIDSIVRKGKITITGFAIRHIFFPPYFIEMGHTISGNCKRIPARKRNEIIRTFKRGVRALGIDNGAAKGDVKFGRILRRGAAREEKPRAYIGEIAARLSGGYMSGWTYPYASGTEVTKAAILLACGKAPGNLKPRKNRTSAERAFISIPGKIREIRGLAAAKKIKYVKDIFLNCAAGDKVKFPENNVEKCGNVISAAPGRKKAVKAAEEAVKNIFIRLETPDNETGAFLRDFSAAFPPSAYKLTPAMLEELDRMPESGAEPTEKTGKPGVRKTVLSVLPFDSFLKSNLKDYAGRTPAESLEAVRKLSGIELRLSGSVAPSAPVPAAPVHGREFWKALIRGGYQGALYYLDLISS